MNIEDLKNMDSKKLIMYAILIVIIILAVLFGFGSDEKNEDADINNLNVEETNSVYESKLEAYKNRKDGNTNPEYTIDMSDMVGTSDNTYQQEDEEIIRLQQSLKEKRYSASEVLPSSPRNENKEAQPPKIISPVLVEKKAESEPKIEKQSDPEPKIEKTPASRFFRAEAKKEKGNVIPVVAHGDQIVTDGSTILFRTLEDLYISDNVLIPKNTYISGIAKLKNNRLDVELQTVKVGKNIYPISKTVYDTDGLKGLELDDDTKTKIAKQASAGAIESTKTPDGGNTNIVTTATTAIGDAAKSVLAKDKREIKITIKNNRKMFLK